MKVGWEVVSDGAGGLDRGRSWRQNECKELTLACMCVGELMQGCMQGGS